MKFFATIIVCGLATLNLLSAQTVQPAAGLTEDGQQIVDAAQAVPEPQFNGPKVVGILPGRPLISSLAVSGDRPIFFAARNLPAGLKLDPQTGIITGSLARAGEYQFTAVA